MGQGRLDSNPKGLIHDDVGIFEISTDPEILSQHVRLTRQVSGKEQSGSDLAIIQLFGELNATDRRTLSQCDRETKPGGI